MSGLPGSSKYSDQDIDTDIDFNKVQKSSQTKKRKVQTKKSVQKYRKAWESEFPWIRPIQGNELNAMCRCCSVKLTADWGVISRHGKGKRHISLAKKIKTQPKINEAFKETALEKQIKRAELLICGFLAEHNIPFLALDHLIPVLQKCFSDSTIAKGMTVARTKASGIVKNVIAKNELEYLVNQLKNVKFSILVDESTDIGTTKNMAICVRYFSEEEKSIQTKFFALIQVFSKSDPEGAQAGATGERIYNEIISLLKKHKIPLDNVIGFGSDGCNVMFGQHNSVVSRLKENLPGIFTSKCICHSLHICASEACKVLPRECEGMARDIFNFFNHSAKRQAEFGEFQEFCNLEPHKILKPAQTRWLSLCSVVKRILEQWGGLELYFRSNFEEHRLNQSEQILNSLTNKENKLFFYFLDWILPKFTSLNAYFQSEKVVLPDLYKKMSQTYKDLLSIYLEVNFITKSEISSIDPENVQHFVALQNMYLGIGVMEHINELNEQQKTDFLVRCRKFLCVACSQIKKRFDFSDSLLQQIIIFNPTCNNKPNTIFPLLQHCKRITKNCSAEEIQRIDDEWRSLILSSDGDELKALPIDEYWVQIQKLQYHDGNIPYKNIGRFVLNILSYPHSNATVERIFSKVNLIKTRIRNRLITPSINALLLTAQSVNKKGSCVHFEPSDKMIYDMTSQQIYFRSSDDNMEFVDDVTFEV